MSLILVVLIPASLASASSVRTEFATYNVPPNSSFTVNVLITGGGNIKGASIGLIIGDGGASINGTDTSPPAPIFTAAAFSPPGGIFDGNNTGDVFSFPLPDLSAFLSTSTNTGNVNANGPDALLTQFTLSVPASATTGADWPLGFSQADTIVDGSGASPITSWTGAMIHVVPPSAGILAWRSVRSHTGLGDRSIVLDPAAGGNSPAGSGGPTVETRGGGIQKIEVDFDSNVTLTATPTAGINVSDGVNGYGTTSVTTVDDNTIAINFDPGVLPDQKCYTITIGPGTVTKTLSGDNNCMVRALVGDSTGNGKVNLGDVLFTRKKLNQPAADNPCHDINLSGGNIDADDFLAIKNAVTTPPHQAHCP